MTIFCGDCLDVMKTFPDNHFSGVVTDPPYGLSFMGKDWDHGIPGVHFWAEALRICKPGSFILAFGGTRTYHRLTCAIEDAGWEIRDCIMWVYGSGFPKGKGCLKPAYEPIILARKKGPNPRLNIDGCRIGTDDTRSPASKNALGLMNDDGWQCKPMTVGSEFGRWPANIIFDEAAGNVLDDQSGILKSGKPGSRKKEWTGYANGLGTLDKESGFGDSGGASRFFYCAKASKSERGSENIHPTVKPLKLMEYLLKLISPSENALILDPFTGSGTTILAAKRLGIKAVGIEKDEEYASIARKRVENSDFPIPIEKEEIGNPDQLDLLSI